MIPKIVHFIFGLNSDFGHRPFSLIHNIAIKSAHDVIKPDKIFLYYKYKPCNNKYWDDITHLVELVEIEPPDEIFGNPIEHFAHKTCVTRLKKLIEFGGIYLDCDTLCINSFDNLLNNKFVMAKQDDVGLCNAIMLSEPNSEFANIWYNNYKTFDKSDWDYHAVKLPKILSEKYPDFITVLETNAFFQPGPPFWKSIFDSFTDKSNDYAMHLWEIKGWNELHKFIDEDWVLSSNSTYGVYAKKYVNNFLKI
jgi:hypothetical protein